MLTSRIPCASVVFYERINTEQNKYTCSSLALYSWHLVLQTTICIMLYMAMRTKTHVLMLRYIIATCCNNHAIACEI